ncbi:serine/threonine-protein kinase/endoribonuclease IRE1 [Episyrphus balteatus]|uniref:serine/threonine-protein kinase/endoribonuclease IRE1 n=1 Tax=Episyrphus balteatus TaxID=286459 RepID=UPI0024864AE2|nr:serine/threonine-protein kinase/endoribonuclease IRE1 [Episyrphus balteatus]
MFKQQNNLIKRLVCFWFCVAIASATKQGCTDVARDEEPLMVFSTLGGGLTAIDPITSEIRWSISDDPPVMSENQPNVPVKQYLPDPRDGSIYQLGDMGDLRKLPYTIPQLVANAPCRSSDGILYSGKKSDTWFLVDPKTGRREKVLGFGSMEKQEGDSIGWATSRSVYLGRTQYTVMMYDSLTRDKNIKPWNITFYDYTSHSMAPDVSSEYEYIHLAATLSGEILTLNRKSGQFLWQRTLNSPIVSAFLLGSEGLLSVPFTSVSDDAFNSIVEESKDGNVNAVELFESLYIGEHSHGLYALPSLVDKDTPRISSKPPVKLLGGPNKPLKEPNNNVVYLKELLDKNKNAIILGHYEMPKNDIKLKISPSRSKGADSQQLATIVEMNGNNNNFVIFESSGGSDGVKGSVEIGIQTDPETEGSSTAFNKTKKLILVNSGRIGQMFNDWLLDHPSGRVHQILIVLVLAMVAMFWYTCSTVRELKNQSENGSKTLNRSSGSSNGSYEDLIDLGDGEVKVGKITFNPTEVLGKGCEGTFVFKGQFEKRRVAVKRLLPECFTFADREVALLRESDAHENVVRYFCTEQDRQFRYIAVELCAATLQDYAEGERAAELRELIETWEVLRQSAAGLTHLHSLNIVHRDIKPQNVLLSLPDVNNRVRVMISDFGLCKKLNFGKTSFSRRSGVTGTEGWIAPEMMRGQRTTTSVDVFSLGCVYYYVLSKGHHAFGDTIKRQGNILSNEFDLSNLEDNSPGEASKMILAEQLIADMVHKDPQFRPPSRCITNHPVFWNGHKILAFLQDVSDRVEKLQFTVEPLKSLEKNGRFVVREDWNLHLDSVITDDLRKYRGYMGASVRDLLRAFRNKKHHYHELSEDVQSILGSIPNEFTNYWIDKFPYLISHVYHAFSICSMENAFKPYYHANYHFSRPDYFEADDSEFISLQQDPKPLQKNTSSPKKIPTDKSSQPKVTGIYRKVAYNLRKNNMPADEMNSAVDGADSNTFEKRDAFANFRLRRNQKQRNFNRNVRWTQNSDATNNE